MLIQTHLQETNPIGNKAKDTILCVDALEKHFDSRPSDVAQQRHWREVIRYFTICPTVLDAETFPVCSRASRHSYSLVAYKTMEIYSNFSKIYERLYLIIRSVCSPGALTDANWDNRWNGTERPTIKSAN